MSRQKRINETIFDSFVNETWMSDGICHNEDPELWFPARWQDPAYAISVCGKCPVQDECLNYALDWPGNTQLLGIWGGTTEKQRRKVVLKRRADVA